MKKLVKYYGNTLHINFTKQEQIVYDIKEGDVIDLSDLVVLRKTRKKGDESGRGVKVSEKVQAS